MSAKVCCYVCHRYRDPAKMEGTRCADREACLKAAANAAPVRVSRSVLRKQFGGDVIR